MRYLSSLILCAYLFILPYAKAGCNIDDISKKISGNPISASFEQTKKIANLSKGLKSKGVIWVSDSHDLVWQVDYPIKNTLVFKKGSLTQFDRKDKKLPQKKGFSDFGMSSLFFNIALGNLNDLSQSFKLTLSCKDDSWVVDLTPKDEDMKKILVSLSIYGSKSVDGFSYREVRGDFTNIKLVKNIENLKVRLNHFLG